MSRVPYLSPREGARLSRRRKKVGAGFAGLPLAVFTMLAIGEAAALEPGWWSHLIQVAAVIAVAALAWTRPRIGGPVLSVIGTVFTTIIASAGGGDALGRLLTSAVLFLPLIVAGVFFSLAGYGSPTTPRTR